MTTSTDGHSDVRHILSINQLTDDAVLDLCGAAMSFEQQAHMDIIDHRAGDRVIANLFYEPSTRTSSSFCAAMAKLGGTVIQINNVQFSSVAKGETLEDTIRTMGCFVDAIVLRHPEAGAAHRAAMVSPVPIINAGDGENEHPTQALLDLYTITSELPGIMQGKPVHVVMMGDLRRGRTVKSLSRLLRRYPHVKISWVSPPSLRVPGEYLAQGEIQTNNVDLVIENCDVLYLTRVQRERGQSSFGNWLRLRMAMRRALLRLAKKSPSSSIWFRKDEHSYQITPAHMQRAKPKMVLMHPLPRTEELPTSLDDDPRSAYFRQMKYGLYMRMAVLAYVMKL